MFHVGLALALGSTGALLFHYLNLPLSWLLSALCATLVVSIAEMPVVIRPGLRKYLIIVLGMMLGGIFSPEVLTRTG